MNSPREVTIVKFMVKDSIHAYREGKKIDKYIVELATIDNDPGVRKLAVELLNEYQAEIRAAQDDPENASLMEDLRKHQRVEEEKLKAAMKNDSSGAKTVPESPDQLDVNNIIGDRKREVKRPALYMDEKWSNSGKFLGTTHENEPGGRSMKRNFHPRSRIAEIFTSDEEEEDEDLGAVSDYGEQHENEDEDLNLSDAGFEETTETPPTEKQRRLQASKKLKASIPVWSEQSRTLVNKLLAEYHREYTDDDLNTDSILRRALKYIHCRKMGLPLDDTPTIHVKVCTPKPLFIILLIVPLV